MINAKNGGTDIGSLEHVLANYNFQSRSNANTVIASIEFVKNCYSPKLLGSESLGHILALARNIGIDLIDLSDLMKYNFMNFASGNYTHPLKYAWQNDILYNQTQE